LSQVAAASRYFGFLNRFLFLLAACSLPQEKVQSTRPDLQQTAVFVLDLMKRLQAMQARVRFAMLPKEVFAIEHYDRLASVAGAAFHAQRMLDSAQAVQSDAKFRWRWSKRVPK
jgi:hypothetical protein